MNPRPEVILLAEDDENDQFFMQIALQRAEVRDPLHIVGNGRDAIAYLAGEKPYDDREKYPQPTILFLDIQMPYLSGFDVLEWLRSRRNEFSNLVVIVLTSSPEERDHTRAYQLGARSYLLKPPTREMILDIWKMLALRPPPAGGPHES